MTMMALVNKIKINVKQIFEYQILHPPFIYMGTSKLYYPIGKETLAPYSVI
jgi:hypothetical protein